MNKTQNNDKAFDQLLKQAFLEQKDDKLIEKTINMNANYIFSQDIKSVIPEAKLEQLLSRHQISDSVILNRFQKLIYWVIPSILLMGLAFFANNKFNKPNKQNFVPPIIEQRDTTNIEQLKTKEIKNIESSKISPKLIADFPSANENEVENNLRKEESHWKSNAGSGTFRKNYQINYPDLYEAPAPTFEAEPCPEDYILKTTILSKPKNNNLFALLKASYFVSYYEGQPFAKGMEDFVYVNEAERILRDRGIVKYLRGIDKGKIAYYRQELNIPYSFKYHLNNYELNNEKKFVIDTLTKQQLDLLLQPYYFSKYEVSIKAYQEFTKWVYESNGFTLKSSSLDSTAEQNAYYLDWLRNKDNAFKYTFYNPSKKVLTALKGNTINIAPLDTMLGDTWNSPLMPYNVNPFYSKWAALGDLAVVGVSYYQALAFLDWKTHFHQEQLDKQGYNYEIEYSLPNTLERRLVIDKAEMFSDENWIYDLKTSSIEDNNLDHIINNYGIYKSYIKPLSLGPVSYVDITKNKTGAKFALPNNITWLGGNASEWLSDSYQDNWKDLFEAHKKQVKGTEAGDLSLLIEEYYNQSNAENGQLVMGGNFLDNRYGLINMHFGQKDMSFNKVGVYLKKFLNPYKQYETVGFRYIVKVKDSDEKDKEELLQLVGTYNKNKYLKFPHNYSENYKVFDEGKYILDQEVTNGMWRTFLMNLIEENKTEDLKICLPKSKNWAKYNLNYIYYFKELKYEDLPVVNISHQAVEIYMKWLTKVYNSNPLRKFGIVEFKLPSELEWEKAAKGSFASLSEFAWADISPRDYKGKILANFTLSPYELNHFSYPIDSIYKKEYTNSLLKAYIKKGTISEKERMSYYEDFLLDKISYSEFMKQYEKDWLSKEEFRLYASPAQIKELKKDKEIFLKKHLLTVGKLFPPNMTGLLGNKNDALYDIMGNVAEMIENPKRTKGGSWNSFANLSTILRHEPWNGEASPMVGFRPVMKVLYKSFDHNRKVKANSIPPGTVLLNKNYGVDLTEVRNVDYREYMYYTMQVYGKNSQEYLNILPDTMVWNFKNDSLKEEQTYIINDSLSNKDWNNPLTNFYFRHPAYKNYPVAGVSYEQAKAYCSWRSDRVNEFYAIYHAKNLKDNSIPKKVIYRLPSPKEWEVFSKIDSIYTDKGYVKKEAKNTEKERVKLIEKQGRLYTTTPVNFDYPTAIGLYGIEGNLSEMTSVKGQAKGENWAQKYLQQESKDIKYTKAESWIGFRCVVDVEY